MNNTCKCGCGTQIPDHSSWARGHNAKRGDMRTPTEIPDPNPTEFCMCGCGEKTKIATVTNIRDGAVRGKPRRFVVGHGGRLHVGSARKQWKGGRIVTDQGYSKVSVAEAPGRRSRYVYEHRVVMEQVLGRPLDPAEQVHHINGDKLDNRPENLELWHRSQPNGIRREDYHCPGCQCGS